MIAFDNSSNVTNLAGNYASQRSAIIMLPQLQDYEHSHWSQFYRNGQLPAPTWVHMSTGVFVLVVGLTGTAGNALLAWAFSCYMSLRSPSNLLIANLAVADLGLSAVTFPLLSISSFAEKWVFGKAGCDYYGASAGFFGMLSIGTMASIAVDRYFSITSRAQWHLTYRRVTYWITALWIFAFSLVIPPVLGWSSYILEGIQTSCTWDFLTRSAADIAFTLYLFVVGFVFPLFVIAVCYAQIILHIISHRKLMENFGFGTSGGPMRSRTSLSASQAQSRSGSHAGTSINLRTEFAASRDGHHPVEPAARLYTASVDQDEEAGPKQCRLSAEIRAAVTCGVIVILFCLAWTPYAVIALTSTFGYPDLVTPYVNSLPALFAKTNTIYNPIVYALMNERFRSAIWSTVRFRRTGTKTDNPSNSVLRESSPRGPDPYRSQLLTERAPLLRIRTAPFTGASTPVDPTQFLLPIMQQPSFDAIDENCRGMVDGANVVSV